MYGVGICIPVAMLEMAIEQAMLGGSPTDLFDTTIQAFFVAALPEESFKLLALWLLLRKNPYFDEHFDGIVYAVCVGLGFAAVENVFFVVGEEGNWMGVAVNRALLAVPGHYAFAVVLPKEGMTPAEYLATLDGASLRTLLQGELYDEVHTAMPKFKTECSSDLIPVFQKAGLTDLTGLDGIAKEAFVSGAVHKAVIDVNEEGVSAAAVTAIEGAGSGIPKQEKIATVIADRPYIYMIVDIDTNVPLFIGVNESV